MFFNSPKSRFSSDIVAWTISILVPKKRCLNPGVARHRRVRVCREDGMVRMCMYVGSKEIGVRDHGCLVELVMELGI